MATRKTNGEGSIAYKASKKLYEGRITIGFDSNGKQLRKSVYAKTKTKLIEKMNKLKTEFLVYDYTENADISIYDIAKPYINNKYNANQVSAASFLRDNHTLSIIDKLKFSHLPIKKVTNQQISSDLLDIKEYSNSILIKVYGMLSNAYNQAIINNIVKIYLNTFFIIITSPLFYIILYKLCYTLITPYVIHLLLFPHYP